MTEPKDMDLDWLGPEGPWTPVLRFWLGEVGPKGWFRADPVVDAACEDRFGAQVRDAAAGALDAWAATRDGALALLVLLDQLPRNLYRADARAFAADPKARAIAEAAIAADFDLDTPAGARALFYLPFTHSEALADQDRGVALYEDRFPEGAEPLRHARLHRDLIVRFGRFPHRNAVLGRQPTAAEEAHLAGGGYAPGSKPTDAGEGEGER